MRITKKSLIVVFCLLTTITQKCNASDNALQDYVNTRSEKDLLKSQALYYVPEFKSDLNDRSTKQQYTTGARPSALDTANDSEKDILDTFNQGDDNKTEKAANLALLLIANGPVKTAEREIARHTQTRQDGKELMIAGASIFAFFQSWNLFNVPPTSYYADLRNQGILVGNTLGILFTAAGLFKYKLGKSRLEKAQSKK